MASSSGIGEKQMKRVPWIVQIERNMTILTEQVMQKAKKPKIQRVPSIFREKNPESNKYCFEPMVVSIRPFHHGQPALQQMEPYKFQFAQQFAGNTNNSMEDLYLMVEERAIDARKCYAKGSTDAFDDDKEFAKMMFLDGCFLLQFIYYCLNPHKVDVKMKINNRAFILSDILLLENQLPFEFLIALMRYRFKKGEGEKMIDDFLEEIIQTRSQPYKEEPAHLLELVRAKFIDFDEMKKGRWYSSMTEMNSHASVQELKSVGIKVKPNNTGRFSDIKFQSGWLHGCLRIPAMTINDRTTSRLLNLLAWENCPDSPTDFGVSSYVSFMDTLINHAEDVKELRYKGIILNGLGTDKEVAKLFNNLGRFLVSNPKAYGKVKKSIADHCKSRISLKVAKWMHNHFSNSWVVAFLATTIVIVLTIAQTVLGALQL